MIPAGAGVWDEQMTCAGTGCIFQIAAMQQSGY